MRLTLVDSRVAGAASRIGAGEDFVSPAQELSDDIGSAAIGGDLGSLMALSSPIRWKMLLPI